MKIVRSRLRRDLFCYKNLIVKTDISAIRNVNAIRALAVECADDPAVLDFVLSELKTGKDERNGKNASWILSVAAEKSPEIFAAKQLKIIFNALCMAQTGTVKRNLIRIFQFVRVGGEQGLEIIDKAFALLSNPEEDLAVRVFSLTVLEKHLDLLPEIAMEVEFLMDKQQSQLSPSFAFRLKNFRKTATKMGL